MHASPSRLSPTSTPARTGPGRTRTDDAAGGMIVEATSPKGFDRFIAVLLFALPITGVMAGAVSIEGVTPHVVTSALFALVGIAAVLRPHRKISRLAATVALLAGTWLVVALLHIVFLNVPATNEVTISLSGLAILLGVAAVRVSGRTFNALIVGWTFAYFLAAAAAILEKYFGFVPQNSYLVLQGYKLEAVGLSSLFGNPNGFGLFLLASSVIFIPFALSARRPLVRALYFALQVSTLYFMFESGSRTGVTCLFVVLVVTLWNLLYKRDLARFLLIIMVIVVVISQLLTPAGTALVNGLRDSSLFSDTDDGSFLLRLNLVRNGLIFLADSPLIGIGPDMYETLIQTRPGLYPTSFIINPHNGLIEILSQYGVIVFGLFVILLVQSAVSAWRLMRTAGSKRDRNYALGLAQLLLIVFLPFTTTMHSTFLGAPAAWLYLCALIALGRMAIPAAGSGPAPESQGRPSAPPRSGAAAPADA